MGAAVAFAALPAARGAAVDPVERAMAAAGGRALLSHVRAMEWSSTARIMLGATPVDLLIETRIEPFVRGRLVTWLASAGRSTARTLMVERDSGFLVQDGAQTPMPAAQARFERQQFGAYAYLLLAPAFVSAGSRGQLHAAHDDYPPIALTLAKDERIASAEYAIASPDREDVGVRQNLTFVGTIESQGVRFPRLVAVVEDGHPLLRMTIMDFSVELMPQ